MYCYLSVILTFCLRSHRVIFTVSTNTLCSYWKWSVSATSNIMTIQMKHNNVSFEGFNTQLILVRHSYIFCLNLPNLPIFFLYVFMSIFCRKECILMYILSVFIESHVNLFIKERNTMWTKNTLKKYYKVDKFLVLSVWVKILMLSDCIVCMLLINHCNYICFKYLHCVKFLHF